MATDDSAAEEAVVTAAEVEDSEEWAMMGLAEAHLRTVSFDFAVILYRNPGTMYAP